jgi:hypothetical protein
MKKKTSTSPLASRRNFLKKAGLGGLSAGLILNESIHEQLAHLTQKVNRLSAPSDLKITDMRIAEISGVVFRTPIVRIYTNQGIVGHGDVRDQACDDCSLCRFFNHYNVTIDAADDFLFVDRSCTSIDLLVPQFSAAAILKTARGPPTA